MKSENHIYSREEKVLTHGFLHHMLTYCKLYTSINKLSLISITAECPIALVQKIPNNKCILSFSILLSFKSLVGKILYDSCVSDRKDFQVHIELFKGKKNVGR